MSGITRFALVGCGAISKKHIKALEQMENGELAAVCDMDSDFAKSLGEKNGVPWFSDPLEMAKAVEFDVFTILTPSGDHARTVLKLAHVGRHFVIEKPLALRILDADEVLRACDQSGSKIFVVKQNRYNAPVQALHKALRQDRFGKLVMGTVRVRWCRLQEYYDAKPWRGTWAEDGGVLTNQASHHIDLLCWLMGDVESVVAKTSTRLVDIEAEDTGIAILKFTSGALGIIEATTAIRPKDLEGSISIMGERGSVEIGGFYANQLKTWNFVDETPDDKTVFEDWGNNPDAWAWNHAEYLSGVVESLQTGKRALVDGLEGRKSLELINAIYESAETGKEITLKFNPKHSRLGSL